MQVKYTYSQSELESAVKFISQHNKYFLGRDDEIKFAMMESMEYEAKKFPNCSWFSTMGFMIQPEDIFEESIDVNQNSIHFSIYVDPSLFLDDKFADGDEQIKVIEI